MTDASPSRGYRKGKGGNPTWQKGVSGNPKGKPKGCRDKVTRLAEEMMRGDAEGVVQTVIDRAKAGDMVAAKLVLERIAPPRRGRAAPFPLPPVQTAADVLAAVSAVVAAVAAGDLTPDEGQQLAAVLESSRKTIELADVERRLAALEAQQEENAS